MLYICNSVETTLNGFSLFACLLWNQYVVNKHPFNTCNHKCERKKSLPGSLQTTWVCRKHAILKPPREQRELRALRSIVDISSGNYSLEKPHPVQPIASIFVFFFFVPVFLSLPFFLIYPPPLSHTRIGLLRTQKCKTDLLRTQSWKILTSLE